MTFDFSKFKTGLFKIKEKEKEIIIPANEPEEKISFQRHGFKQAGSMNGSTEGLKICLNRVYQEHMALMRRDENRQEELRKPFKITLQELNTTNEGLKNQITTIETEIIPSKEEKIENLKKDISDIRKNPDHYTGNHVGKAGFYIGAFILTFLTLYLFVFYSSASYSALFKDFQIDDAVITKAIFDAKAITKALKDGISELLLILTIPFVFIGLGYLIHKFQEAKGKSKYLKITALLIVTFIFDTILAYEITQKIYDIKKGNSFQPIPDYSLKLAFSSVSFWLIIFAGFVVYLIWGFVFDFVMDSFAKLDVIKVHIKAKQEQIDSIEKDISDSENKINNLKILKDKNQIEINKLKDIINGTIIQPKEVKEALSQFMVGWYNWLSHGREYNRSEHNKIYDEFIALNVTVIESVINPN